MLPQGLLGGQVQSLKSSLEAKQLTVNKSKTKITVNSYTGIELVKLLNNYTDLIPEEHRGYYVNRLKEIGKDRFIELANKARAGSDTPERLFCWMLKHPELVR